MPFTLAQPTELIEDIKKSRFLTRAFPIASLDEFDTMLAQLKASEEATHHCWAWKFGNAYRFSDDGEPTGTAGKPILNAIEGRDCDKVAIITTRWYGGIQLGTGGLARAYGGGAARCLQQGELVEIIAMAKCNIELHFSEWPIVESRLPNYKALILSQEFGATGVDLELEMPDSNFPAFMDYLKDLTRGRIMLKNEDDTKE
ncbi:IMPACT family protein [Bartonella sp. HY406]|uniref:IMPACT family protein n=1 Tax=Bartonella sp. HY406 TaxID=2979331 RepID=UPI0021C5FD7B|nr:YigZ family protein [Bartonella sp. HY406]UXN03017.1 IMPACT family protein [Bartonella sp. HY406]